MTIENKGSVPNASKAYLLPGGTPAMDANDFIEQLCRKEDEEFIASAPRVDAGLDEIVLSLHNDTSMFSAQEQKSIRHFPGSRGIARAEMDYRGNLGGGTPRNPLKVPLQKRNS